MFCSSCGKKIDDESIFCEFCGAKQGPIAPAQPPPAVQAPRQAASSPQAPRVRPAAPVQAQTAGGAAAPAVPQKPMSTRTKIAVCAAAAVVVLFFGLKALLGSLYDPSKTVNRFTDAIRAQDGEALRAVAFVANDELELTDGVLQPFFAAYSQDESALASFGESLLGDLGYLNRGAEAPGDGFIRLTADANFLFTSYKVELTPCSVSLRSEFDNTALTLAGTEYQIGTQRTDVKLMPGTYSGSASCTAPETGAKLSVEIADRAVGRNGGSIDCYFDYGYAYFELTSDAITIESIGIDGVPYTGNLEEFVWSFDLAPVAWDSEVTVAYSVAGIPFEESFQIQQDSENYFPLAPTFPEDLLAEGEAMAIDIASLVLRLSYSFNTGVLGRLAESYGASSPDFVSEWTQYVQDGRAYRDERTERYGATAATYAGCDNLVIGETSSSVNFRSDSVSVTYTVPITSYTVTNYWWGTADVTGTGTGSRTYRVEFSYVDGQWQIVRVY